MTFGSLEINEDNQKLVKWQQHSPNPKATLPQPLGNPSLSDG